MDKNLTLEINPNHEIIVKLNEMRKKDLSIGILILKNSIFNCKIDIR